MGIRSVIAILALACGAEAQAQAQELSTDKLASLLVDKLLGRVLQASPYTDLEQATNAKPGVGVANVPKTAVPQAPIGRPSAPSSLLANARKPQQLTHGIPKNAPRGLDSPLTPLVTRPLGSKSVSAPSIRTRAYGMPIEKEKNSPPSSVIRGPSGRSYTVPFVTGPTGLVYGSHSSQELPYEEQAALLDLIHQHED